MGAILLSSESSIGGIIGGNKKKLPSISYTHILDCFPQLKNNSLEFDVDLDILKKNIDQFSPSAKSIMRYRKVIYEDLISSESKSDSQKKRLTLSLVHLRNQPEYRMSIEKIDDKMTGEIISLPKVHEINPNKEIIKSYLINAKIEEDETYWIDTKLNKLEFSYKISNDSIIELDLSDKSKQKQLKCEKRKDRGVLCLCLKK